MTQIQLRIVPDTGPTITASVFISDANSQRILAAGATAFPGQTNAQLLATVLTRVVRQAIEFTKSHEREAVTVDDIPTS